MNQSIVNKLQIQNQCTPTISKGVRRFSICYIHRAFCLIIDIDDTMEFQSIQKFSNMKDKLTITTPQMSPSTAAQSILSFYSQQLNNSTPAQLTKRSSRVRSKRKFGEVITNGSLLEELKKKDQAKKCKELEPSKPKNRHRPLNK